MMELSGAKDVQDRGSGKLKSMPWLTLSLLA